MQKNEKKFSLAGFLNEIHPYLENLTDNLKESTDTGKIHLPVKIIFKSSKDNGEVREIFLMSETVLFMVGNSTKNLINVIYKLLFTNYLGNMVEKIRGSDFVFDFVDRFYYGCRKVTLNRGGSCIHHSF